MHADELVRPPGAFRQRRDRQGRGVGAEHRPLGDHRLGLGDGVGLHLAVLEHRLDDEVAARERAVVRRRRDAREQCIALGGGGAPALDLLVDQGLRMRLALVGARLVAVDQHHVEPRLRGHVGDAGAHEAGADDADRLQLRGRHRLRPARALVELLHRDEQRADHGGGLRRAQDAREPARFHPQRQIERQLQALVHHLHDRARGRIVVVGFAPVDRVRGRERHHAGLGPDRPARQAEALLVPRRLRSAAGLDPRLRARDEIAGRHHRVDDLEHLGLRHAVLVALEQKLQRVGGRHHARDALGAAGAREQSDLHLGQAQPRAFVVGGDAVMAGETQLEPAAERRAVDRRHPRLAARLQPPAEHRPFAALLEQERRGRLLAARFCRLGIVAAVDLQHGEVGAGAERVLAGGDDRTLDGGVARDGLDDGGEFLRYLAVDDVHRAPGRVPGDERDAVGVDVELEIDVGHVGSWLGPRHPSRLALWARASG